MEEKRIKISHTGNAVEGEIHLSGSKSISNRVLIIKALCNEEVSIENLSTSDDTTTLERLLDSKSDVLDTGHAGTTYRFMTAYLALMGRSVQLKGSERMHQRPIGPLVDALNSMGANITYLNNPGYPPLQFAPAQWTSNEVTLKADISSQFISALLLIAPSLPNGLILQLQSEPISRPYIEMTLRIMQDFGISYNWDKLRIEIPPQAYQGRSYFVESDWSSASYLYADLAIAQKGKITIHGLTSQGLQGDSAIADIMQSFGIETVHGDRHITIQKSDQEIAPFLEFNLINQPDLAQTISVVAAAKGVQLLLSGLQTLKIKETDRIAALKNELAKMGVSLMKLPAKFSQKTNVEYYMQEGKLTPLAKEDEILTYHDHRMAMAFAVCAQLFEIVVVNPDVVSKSYPDFWKDKQSLAYTLDIV